MVDNYIWKSADCNEDQTDGPPDELKNSESKSGEVDDLSTLMTGYLFQLLTTETELVPQIGKFLDESIIVSADPYLGGLALLNPWMLTSIECVKTSTMDTAQVLPECFLVLEVVWAQAVAV